MAALARRQEAQGRAAIQVGFFAAGYLAVWAVFSFAASASQWSIDQMAMLTLDMRLASGVFIMNLAWIAGLALLIMVEKVAPAGDIVSRVAGVALAVWGSVTIATALSA